MPNAIPLRRVPVLVAAACLLAGCNRGGARADAGPAKMDTANAQWEDGLSAEQVQGEARAMSPEEAARAGIAVDSSIHLESLGQQDSVPFAAPATTGAGRADTLPDVAPPVGSQGSPPNQP